MNQLPVIEGNGRSVSRQRATFTRQVKVADIQSVISAHYELSRADLIGRSRKRMVCWPRQMAMSVTRQVTDMSLPEIGRRFGGRDHTTVLHACEAVMLRCDRIAEQRADLDAFLAILAPVARAEFIRRETIYGRFSSVRRGALQ